MSYDYHRTNTQGYRLCGLHSVAHYQSLWPCASSWDFTHWSSRCPPGCDTCHFHSFCVSACPGASRYQCQNKSLSRTQLQGFGNSNPTMCQEERELETPLKNTNNYQSFVDSGPGPWQNREGRTFPLGAPDCQCLFSSLFPCPYLCPFSVLGPFFSTIRTGDYLIFLLVCIILKSMLYLQDYFPFLALSLIMELKPSPQWMGRDSFLWSRVRNWGAGASGRSSKFTRCRWEHACMLALFGRYNQLRWNFLKELTL